MQEVHREAPPCRDHRRAGTFLHRANGRPAHPARAEGARNTTNREVTVNVQADPGVRVA